MGLRIGINPSNRTHPFNFVGFGEKMAKDMLGLRQTISREQYPKAILRMLLVNVYPLQQAWQSLDESFAGKKEYEEFSDAVASVDKTLQPYFNDVLKSADTLLSGDAKCGPISFREMMGMVNNAARGDNGMVEELEFSCACHAVIKPLCVHWAALGLMGVGREDAYRDLVDCLFTDDEKRKKDFEEDMEREKRGENMSGRHYQLYTFEDAFQSFRMSATGSMTNGVFGPPAYQQLPPLW